MNGIGDFETYDGLGLAELVRTRQVTPEELLEAILARIDKLNPTVNAVVTRMDDHARAAIASGLPGGGPFPARRSRWRASSRATT